MKCFFCKDKIEKGDVNFTLILHNDGSKRNGKKMPLCYNCIQFLNQKKRKDYVKGTILR